MADLVEASGSRERVSQILFAYLTTFAIAVLHLHHIVRGFASNLIALFAETGLSARSGSLYGMGRSRELGWRDSVRGPGVRFGILKRESGPKREG